MNFPLSKKLASYSVMATALLAIEPKAGAQIIYTPVNPNFVGSDTSYLLDLNNDGIPDYKITSGGFIHDVYGSNWQSDSASNFIAVNGYGSNQMGSIPLKYGSAINSKNKSWGPYQTLAHRHSTYKTSFGGPVGSNLTISGPWVYADTAYLPLKLNVAGNTYYGWARLYAGISEFVLTGYAYNAQNDSTIYAGQECNIQFPIPAIHQNDSTLLTSATSKIQWYYNTLPLTGDTLQNITTTTYGIYSVTSGDTTSCHAKSLPFNYINCNTFHPIINVPSTIICAYTYANIKLDSLPSYYSVHWLKNDSLLPVDPLQTLTTNLSGNYQVVIYEQGGCSDTSNSLLLTNAMPPNPYPNITEHGDTLFSNYNKGNIWSDGDTSQYTIPPQQGYYDLCVTDSFACIYCDNGFTYVNCNTFHPKIISKFTGICPGTGTTLISVDTLPFSYSINWYRNDSLLSLLEAYKTISANSVGNYFAIVSLKGACTDTTQTIFLPLDSTLIQPVISIHGDSLISSTAYGNQWYNFNNNDSIPGAINQVYIPKKTGYYYVLVTDSFGCTSYSNTIYYTIPSGIGIIHDQSTQPNIFENSNLLTIKFNGHHYDDYQLSIYNYMGQKVYSSKILSDKMIINLGELEKGLYIVSLHNSSMYISKKIVLQ